MDSFNYTYIMINELYKSRFSELIRKVNLLLKEKNKNLFSYQLLLVIIKIFVLSY